MKLNFLRIGVLTLGLLIIGQIHAQEDKRDRKGPPPAERVMEQLDSNQDELISLEEAQSAERKRLSEHFEQLDENSDGFINLEELKAAREKRKTKRQSCKK